MAGAFGEHREADSLGEAYAYCQQVARRHYENFPVASWLLPAGMRPHVAAVYAFARLADDYADEGSLSPSERETALDVWRARLHACVAGGPRPAVDEDEPHRQVFIALGATIRDRSLPVSLFDDLLSAFRQDVRVARYRSWDDLFDYCRRSANPVGRLVLRIAGRQDAELDEASDAVCTALQLTNFWQDLDVDFRRGRLYLPASEREAAGALEEDLASRRLTPAWRAALARAVEKTRALFDRGRPVADRVPGRLGLELRLTWLGGMRILDRLERAQYDVFAERPTLGLRDAAAILSRAARWDRRRK